MSFKKRPSKRRVKARLRLGREVTMLDVIGHDLDWEVNEPDFYLDWNRETVRRIR